VPTKTPLLASPASRSCNCFLSNGVESTVEVYDALLPAARR
jgi:hypothetical protein